MQLPRHLAAVVFDMDGLLIDSARAYTEALVNVAKQLGYNIPDSAQWVGLMGFELKKRLIENFGAQFPLELYYKQVNEYFNERMEQGAPLKEGSIELLDFLKSIQLPCAVATSASRETAFHHLSKTNIISYFQVVITRDDVAKSKPHPDVYLEAANRLGVEASECLALEDSYHGIRAAHAAGMMPIMVPDTLPATPEMHEKCITIAESLHAVKNHLLQVSAP
ncbi:MAG: HAD family phosphatase [Pseudomonadota bacterium]